MVAPGSAALVLQVMFICSILNFVSMFLMRKQFTGDIGQAVVTITQNHNAFRFCRYYATKKKKQGSDTIGPEFSRVINVGQIPSQKPVLCRLLAKETERNGLCERFDIPHLPYFAANITLSRQDESSILVVGTIIAHVKSGDLLDVEVLEGKFDTLILDNADEARDMLSLDENTDYDDEVGPNGDIDIGEIAAQYLALEMY